MAAVAIILACCIQAASLDSRGGADAERAARIGGLLANVEPAYRPVCSAMLRGGSATMAQVWQDWYVFHNVFPDRLTWGNGTYVDFGTNEPTVISNTLFFDKCLGWRGVCVEANPQLHAKIRATRGCTLVPTCVHSRATRGIVRGQGGHARVDIVGRRAIECIQPAEALERGGMGAGAQIDFISIDVEGAEAEVLRCLPLAARGVRAVLIEADKQPAELMQLWFHRQGYVLDNAFVLPVPAGTKVLDHLYTRRPQRAIYPRARNGRLVDALDHVDGDPPPGGSAPGVASAEQPACALTRNFTSWYCQPWEHWMRSARLKSKAGARGRGWDLCHTAPSRLSQLPREGAL